MCEENNSKSDRSVEYSFEENYMITCFRKSDIRVQRSLLRYFELLSLEKREDKSRPDLERNVTVIRDADGNHIVLINDKRFKGLSRADWKEVENYLKSYIGECYEITYCSEKIFIDTDFPDEYANSESRIALKGPRRVAKANAAQAATTDTSTSQTPSALPDGSTPQPIPTPVTRRFRERRSLPQARTRMPFSCRITQRSQSVTATTNGESSAAIRSDRGGGTMVVDGRTYTSNGTGSPAIYRSETAHLRCRAM